MNKFESFLVPDHGVLEKILQETEMLQCKKNLNFPEMAVLKKKMKTDIKTSYQGPTNLCE